VKQDIQPTQPFEPELIPIPAGEFLMGSDPEQDKQAAGDEQPQHKLCLPDYYMARTPVTNAQYLPFVQATFRQPPGWKACRPPAGQEDHPVVTVNWEDAMAYSRWLAEMTGKPYRLPSEAEWEKAARGPEGRAYPWGDEWDEKRCNSLEGGKGGTSPVGWYSPAGDSPYGCADMAGNVWEWTRSLWGDEWPEPDFKYPYHPEDGRENLKARGGVMRVLRGGSFDYSLKLVRCAFRNRMVPKPRHVYSNFGFRVCLTAEG